MNNYQKSSSQKIKELEKLGYKNQFVFVDENLSIAGKNILFDHSDIIIDKQYRFEGISNPDDMSILYAISTRKGYKGTILLPYGTYGNRNVIKFFLEVENKIE